MASPRFEIYFAVLLDESRRRALWIRQTLFVPKQGEGKATIWGAFFDADMPGSHRAYRAKRFTSLDQVETGEGEQLIKIGDATMSRTGAVGSVPGLAWDLTWWGGTPPGRELPAWVPAPTHARSLLHDAEWEGTVTQADSPPRTLRGRAIAMHLWGNKRVPTLHWIWTPWLAGTTDGDRTQTSSLEITAVSLRDTFSLGISDLHLSGPSPVHGIPATAAHPHGLVTATVVGPRRLIHVHAWAEAEELVGYAYRDTDDRDLMIAQSDIGSVHYESFARRAPGLPWHLTNERRTSGGAAVEIHQRAALPGVDYLGWDEDTRAAITKRKVSPPRGDVIEWPELGSIVALGMTYSDHIKETGQTVAKDAPPIAFAKHARAFVVGDSAVRVPTHDELRAALVELEPALADSLAKISPLLPAVMDYEGEVALVALDDIDEPRLLAGVAQPFGLAACNDITARICQVLGDGTERTYEFWSLAKSFPGFLPVSPSIWVPSDGIARMPDVTIVTRVNGEERQRASTKNIIYDLPAIVRAASTQLGRPLRRGDVILTGTPAGVGMRLSAVKRRIAKLVKDRFRRAELLVSTYATSNALLRPGDVVEVEAGPAGSVRSRLVV